MTVAVLPSPPPPLGPCGKSPRFGAGKTGLAVWFAVVWSQPGPFAINVAPFHAQYYSRHLDTVSGWGTRDTPTSEQTRTRRACARGPGRPPPSGPGRPRAGRAPHLSEVTRMRSSLDDCCSSSLSWKCSCRHCSSNSCSLFSSSSPRNSSAPRDKRAPVRRRPPAPQPPRCRRRPVSRPSRASSRKEGCDTRQNGSLNTRDKIHSRSGCGTKFCFSGKLLHVS